MGVRRERKWIKVNLYRVYRHAEKTEGQMESREIAQVLFVPGFTWVWSLYHNNEEWGTDTEGRFCCGPCVAAQSISKYSLSFLWPQWSHTDDYLLSRTFQSTLSSQNQVTGFYWDYKRFPPTVCSYPLYPVLSPCTYKELLTILV